MTYLVPIIVLAIIAIQLFFFLSNRRRMRGFSHIFAVRHSWEVIKDEKTGTVRGISGRGNSTFGSIVESINIYLGHNRGSVIDFDLLKDAVDRHCDAVEDDINSQMPVPLYCGLAGTMAGVIIGLWALLGTDSISALMGATTTANVGQATNAAADGVNGLLTGVAWAMVSSICGIVLTTINSVGFKKRKLMEEGGKNAFLAWMQATLLPELPQDTSHVIKQLVGNLDNFNNSFSVNSRQLNDTLQRINESYRGQAEVLEKVNKLDIQKVSAANLVVLKELQNCTDKLEQFNRYLDRVHEFTDELQHFISTFHGESERLHVLEEIRDFFARYKGEIARDTADADVALREALKAMKAASAEGIGEMSAALTEQLQAYRTDSQQLTSLLIEQLKEMPRLARDLDDIADVPAQIDKLIRSVEGTAESRNLDLMNAVERRLRDFTAQMRDLKGGRGLPRWVGVAMVVAMLAFGSIISYQLMGISKSLEQQQIPIDTAQVDTNVKPDSVAHGK